MTPSEKYLAELCRKSFLSLWSYPHIYNDDGIAKRGIGKEICDLLVVFGNDVIIFSDKSCEYKYTNRLAVDWNRWYRKAIEKSANQLYGAERWLKSFPQRIYLDATAKTPFPINLPPVKEMRVYRVAVALGAKDVCRGFYGGSGSLKIITNCLPIMENDTQIDKAFTIGHFDPNKGYIHVFDDVTLDIVMRELDTVSDFIAYLRKKEEFFQTTKVNATGEEELLSMYLGNIDPDGRHGFDFGRGKFDVVMIPEGEWQYFQSSEEYRAKKEADSISFVWDRLIEHFNETFAAGQLTDPIEARDYEQAIRRMASLNRLERRMIGKRITEVLFKTDGEATRFSAALMGQDRKLAIAIVLFPPQPDRTYEEYRQVRRNLLHAYCNILKYKNPYLQEAVGLAMEPHKNKRGGSEDILFQTFQDWSANDEQQAKKDMEMLKLSLPETKLSEKEYPVTSIEPKASLPHSDLDENRSARRRRKKLARSSRLTPP